MDDFSSGPELVAIGRVARAQGRRGEVVIDPLTDFPGRFHNLERVFIENEHGEWVVLRLEGVREQRGRPVLKFLGVSGISEAERLAGSELRIPESEPCPLPENSLYHFQIIGCSVWDSRSGYLGTVEEIMTTGGTDLLVVRNDEGDEFLIPLCEEICRHIDTERERINIQAPEGLVTLNAR